MLIGSTSDNMLDRADKGTDPFHNLHDWLGGRGIRKTRDIIIHLSEQPVELTLQLWEPSTKQFVINPKGCDVLQTYRLEIKLDRTCPKRLVSLSVPKRRL